MFADESLNLVQFVRFETVIGCQTHRVKPELGFRFLCVLLSERRSGEGEKIVFEQDRFPLSRRRNAFVSRSGRRERGVEPALSLSKGGEAVIGEKQNGRRGLEVDSAAFSYNRIGLNSGSGLVFWR